MSVVSVKRLFSGRRSADTGQERTYTQQFLVECSSNDDGPQIARQANTIPRVGDPLEDGNVVDSTQRARSVSADPFQDEPRTFLVTVEYASNSGSGQEAENPLDRPAERSWGHRTIEVVADVDIDGDPITTVNDEPFDPPLMKDEVLPVYRVTRNQSSYNEPLAIQYMGAINSDPFMEADPKQARITAIDAQELYEAGVWYWRVTVEVTFRRRGWVRDVLHQGLYVLSNDDPPKLIRAKDQQGRDRTTPVLLGLDGKPLPDGQPAIYLPFRVEDELPFGGVLTP